MSLLITTLTVTLAVAQGGLLKSLRSGMKYVETASAIVMILSGLYLSWYWFNDIRDKYDDNLTGRVLNWQERIAQYIDDNRLVLAIAFAIIVGIALTYTFVSQRREVKQNS